MTQIGLKCFSSLSLYMQKYWLVAFTSFSQAVKTDMPLILKIEFSVQTCTSVSLINDFCLKKIYNMIGWEFK